MRWGDKVWQALHPPPNSNQPVCTHTEKVITTRVHTHRHARVCLPPSKWWDSDWLSVHLSGVSCQAKAQVLTHIPNTSGRPSAALKGYRTKYSCTSKHKHNIHEIPRAGGGVSDLYFTAVMNSIKWLLLFHCLLHCASSICWKSSRVGEGVLVCTTWSSHTSSRRFTLEKNGFDGGAETGWVFYRE